jgi:hypothetical protein
MHKGLRSRGAQDLLGVHPNLSGRLSWLGGDCSKIYGVAVDLYGDCTYLSGDVTGVFGCATGKEGSLDDCGLTAEDRARGVYIGDITAE